MLRDAVRHHAGLAAPWRARVHLAVTSVASALSLLVAIATSARAQTSATRDSASAADTTIAPDATPRLSLRTRVVFYGDNTEFFTPYRLGETIFGSQLTTAFLARPQRNVELLAGAWIDYRYGSSQFVDSVKPVLSLRWHSRGASRDEGRRLASDTAALPDGTTGVLGTLITERRHGFLEPIEVTTLDLTRPLEYGAQLLERRRWVRADAFLNWQHVLHRTEREVLGFGGVLAITPTSWLALEGQYHGVHHGGQAYFGSQPVANNVVDAIGVRLSPRIPLLGTTTLAAFRLRSHGNIDTTFADAPRRGHGVYLRGGISPWSSGELFTIYWQGRDFIAEDGDRNYASEGFTYTPYYRSPRSYVEIGYLHRVVSARGLGLDAEVRLHRMDHQPSGDPIFGKTWEYSYRLIARVPMLAVIRR